MKFQKAPMTDLLLLLLAGVLRANERSLAQKCCRTAARMFTHCAEAAAAAGLEDQVSDRLCAARGSRLCRARISRLLDFCSPGLRSSQTRSSIVKIVRALERAQAQFRRLALCNWNKGGFCPLCDRLPADTGGAPPALRRRTRALSAGPAGAGAGRAPCLARPRHDGRRDHPTSDGACGWRDGARARADMARLACSVAQCI
jgi:hypothetical protein